RAAARVSHRGVVTVYDVATEDGRPWIVMELVPAGAGVGRQPRTGRGSRPCWEPRASARMVSRWDRTVRPRGGVVSRWGGSAAPGPGVRGR
ncbi:hypothetical protein AB0N28_07785, partial [Streptomyces sp. NPDC051130]|uniref:hypothetical protein n=1 Tax=Streptomyces sp. NPDC051130 TaxID=3157223 RepID=UPI0034468AF9